MTIHAVSLAHMEPAIMGMSFAQMLRTGLPVGAVNWVLVDHHWPINPSNFSACVNQLAKMIDARVISPEKNLGGTNGINFALSQIDLKSTDYLLWVDPDSFPITYGWFQAMVAVMEADPTIATLSLWPADLSHTDWQEEVVAGYNVRTFPSHSEMFSMTMWRVSFAAPKICAYHEFYGQPEAPAFNKARELGMRNAWLTDFKESLCPIPHPQVYEDWKMLHTRNLFMGNFKEFYDARCGSESSLGSGTKS